MKRIAILFCVLAVAVAGCFRFRAREVSPGQAPLARLDAASMNQLRSDFNADSGEPRMILLLSPT